MSATVFEAASPATIEQDQDDLVPVSVASLRAMAGLDFDLYLQPEGTLSPRLYRAREIPVTPGDIQNLLDRGVHTLYIRASMASAYRNYLRDHVLADPALPLSERYAMLAQAARAVFDDALHQRDMGALVAVSDDVGREVSQLVSGGEVLLFDLIECMLHDYTTYAHATRVATYATLIAKEFGIQDPEKLRQIATGGLLHDVGKLFLADEIFVKNHRLSPEERARLREHPTQGFRRLAGRSDLSWGSLMMVYQHHERVDGCGYPVGLMGDEIHVWARICAIANSYDGVLRDRPVHDAASAQQMLQHLELQAGRSLDEEITQCWINSIRHNPSPK